MNTKLPTHRVPTHPGEILLKEFIEPYRLTQTDVAQRLGISFVRLNELLNGKRGMTPDTALRLERLFEMPATFWLSLQQGWDLWQAKQSAYEPELRKIEPYPEYVDKKGMKWLVFIGPAMSSGRYGGPPPATADQVVVAFRDAEGNERATTEAAANMPLSKSRLRKLFEAAEDDLQKGERYDDPYSDGRKRPTVGVSPAAGIECHS